MRTQPATRALLDPEQAAAIRAVVPLPKDPNLDVAKPALIESSHEMIHDPMNQAVESGVASRAPPVVPKLLVCSDCHSSSNAQPD